MTEDVWLGPLPAVFAHGIASREWAAVAAGVVSAMTVTKALGAGLLKTGF